MRSFCGKAAVFNGPASKAAEKISKMAMEVTRLQKLAMEVMEAGCWKCVAGEAFRGVSGQRDGSRTADCLSGRPEPGK